MRQQQLIKKAFSRASDTYVNHASVQAYAAEKLAAIMLAHALPSAPHTILEIGCGTGFLTGHLLDDSPVKLYVATDLSFPMVEKCQARFLNSPSFVGIVMNGEDYGIKRFFDWVTANLVFQWFPNPKKVLKNLLKQTSFLGFSVFCSGTFQEWEDLCQQFNVRSGLQPLFSEYKWQNFIPVTHTMHWQLETITKLYESWQVFWQAVKHIGARTPRLGHQPIPVPLLKAMLTAQPGPVRVSYKILYACVQRPSLPLK